MGARWIVPVDMALNKTLSALRMIFQWLHKAWYTVQKADPHIPGPQRGAGRMALSPPRLAPMAMPPRDGPAVV